MVPGILLIEAEDELVCGEGRLDEVGRVADDKTLCNEVGEPEVLWVIAGTEFLDMRTCVTQ